MTLLVTEGHCLRKVRGLHRRDRRCLWTHGRSFRHFEGSWCLLGVLLWYD